MAWFLLPLRCINFVIIVLLPLVVIVILATSLVSLVWPARLLPLHRINVIRRWKVKVGWGKQLGSQPICRMNVVRTRVNVPQILVLCYQFRIRVNGIVTMSQKCKNWLHSH